jgi:nitrite reductase/ring-hydroxylating ferredoxin subunit
MSFLSQVEQATALDPVVSAGQRAARRLPRGPVRDALHGVWLGHPLHPALVLAPVGAWLSASVLDAWPDGARAARRLTIVGLITALPAALAGAADWSEQHEQQMRVGVVHASANLAAIGMHGASLLARRPAAGRALRLAGLAAAGLGGLIGGHLSYRLASGANHAEPVPHLLEPGWHDVRPVDGLPDGQPVRAMIGEVPVVVIQQDGEIHVLADRCSHLSGPLSDGELSGGCLTCPWHGSTFRISDGAVVQGPATAPQPVFATRVRDGVLQACLPGAG